MQPSITDRQKKNEKKKKKKNFWDKRNEKMKRNPVGGSGRGVVIGEEVRARVRKGVEFWGRRRSKENKNRKGAVDRLGTAQYMRN